MTGEADRRERIEAALARFEAGKIKRGKRKSVKLFSVDRHEPNGNRRTWNWIRRGKMNVIDSMGGRSNLPGSGRLATAWHFTRGEYRV